MSLRERLALANEHENQVLDKVINAARATETNRDYQRGWDDAIAFIKRRIEAGDSLSTLIPDIATKNYKSSITVDEELQDMPPDESSQLTGNFDRVYRYQDNLQRAALKMEMEDLGVLPRLHY